MIRRLGASTCPRSSTKGISQKWRSYRGWVNLHNDQGLSSEDQIPVSAMSSHRLLELPVLTGDFTGWRLNAEIGLDGCASLLSRAATHKPPVMLLIEWRLEKAGGRLLP